MNMQDIGYFLYMQQQEEEQQKHIKVNVNDSIDLVGEQPPSNEEKQQKN